MHKFAEFSKKHRFDIYFACLLFFIAITVYLYKVDSITPGIHLDEITIARTSEQLIASSQFVPFIDVNYGHPTPLLYLTGASITLFGKTLLAIRLPSILFGALSVVAFYVLLRLFFNKTVSFVSSLLFLFSYPLIIVSRMAYEITPSLFFQILTMIFVYGSWKKKNLKSYALVGLSLGAGLYTYVGFRTFALIVFALCIFLAIKTTNHLKVRLQKIALLIMGVCIVALPLFFYGFIHKDQFMQRARVLSVFHQGLSREEVVKEVGGSTLRLANIFLPAGSWNNRPIGDPDPRRNPSYTTLFDLGTFLLFLIGVVLLFVRNRRLLLIISLFALSPILNDIFSLERLSDMHYYGLGHPNTLRIAGIIPLVYFVIAFGFAEIKPFFIRWRKEVYTLALLCVSLLVILLNWNAYFNQKFSGYIYRYNGAIVLNVVNLINSTPIGEAYVSSNIVDDGRFSYFIHKGKKIQRFKGDDFKQNLAIIKAHDVTILSLDDNQAAQQLVDYVVSNYADSIRMKQLFSPIGTTDALIFVKIK